MVKGPILMEGTGSCIPLKPSTASDGKFGKVLADKKSLALQAEISSAPPPLAEETRERLRSVVKGGGSPAEAIRIALGSNPMVNNLPARLRDQLFQRVSEVMEPMLNRGGPLKRV